MMFAMIALAATWAWMLGSGIYGYVKFMYRMEGLLGAFKILAGLYVLILIFSIIWTFAAMSAAKDKDDERVKCRRMLICAIIPGLSYILPPAIVFTLVYVYGFKLCLKLYDMFVDVFSDTKQEEAK
mgnify:FL=1